MSGFEPETVLPLAGPAASLKARGRKVTSRLKESLQSRCTGKHWSGRFSFAAWLRGHRDGSNSHTWRARADRHPRRSNASGLSWMAIYRAWKMAEADPSPASAQAGCEEREPFHAHPAVRWKLTAKANGLRTPGAQALAGPKTARGRSPTLLRPGINTSSRCPWPGEPDTSSSCKSSYTAVPPSPARVALPPYDHTKSASRPRPSVWRRSVSPGAAARQSALRLHWDQRRKTATHGSQPFAISRRMAGRDAGSLDSVLASVLLAGRPSNQTPPGTADRVAGPGCG